MRHWPLWIGALVLTSALVLLAGARVDNDLTVFLPTGASADQRLALEQLRQGPGARLILIALDGAQPDVVTAASRALVSALRANPLFQRISNGSGGLDPASRDLLFRYRYLLAGNSRFDTPALRQALTARLEELASPAGALVKQDLAADPSASFRQVLRSLASHGGPTKREGVWVARDGHRALLLAYTAAGGYALAQQSRAVAAIRHAFTQLPQQRALTLQLSGPPVFAVAARDTIRGESITFSVAASVAVALLLWGVYRSLALVLAASVPLLFAIAVGAAAVVLGFGRIHGITLAFGVTLIGVAVDYPIHLFSHAYRDMREAVARVWPTLRLGVLTTVLGYLAMLFSGFGGLAQLGTFAVAGLLAAAAATRWLLPALLPASPLAADWGGGGRYLLPVVAALQQLRWLPPLLALLAGGVLLQESAGLWQTNLNALSPIPAASLRLDRELRQALGAPDVSRLLLLRAPSAEAALGECEALLPALRQLQAQKAIGGFDAPCRYLPSVATQRARRAALPDAATLAHHLAAAAQGLPFRPDLFRPFVADVAASRHLPPLTPHDLDDTLPGLRLQGQLLRDDGAWVALVIPHGVHDDGAGLRALAAHTPTARYLDLHRETEAVMTDYRDATLARCALGLLVMLALLMAVLRSPSALWRVVVPVSSAVLGTAALLVASGHPLSLFHLVSLLLVVGLGVDYALFFNRPPQDAREWRDTVTALVVCNLTTVLVFGLLALAQAPVLQAIGGTVAAGALLSLIFAAAMGDNSQRQADTTPL